MFSQILCQVLTGVLLADSHPLQTSANTAPHVAVRAPRRLTQRAYPSPSPQATRGMVSLKSAHLYRSVPKDLTKATHTGGAVSLIAVVAIMALLVSNAQRFYAVRVERTMEIDQVYDESMVVSFNITLPRLPCALASLDLTDALGTSIHNVTRGLSKMRIDEHTDEKLLSRTDSRWMRPNPTPEIRSQELAGHTRRPLVEIAPHLDVPTFLRKAGRAGLAVVLFHAGWCEWSRQFKPILEYLRSQLQAAEP